MCLKVVVHTLSQPVVSHGFAIYIYLCRYASDLAHSIIASSVFIFRIQMSKDLSSLKYFLLPNPFFVHDIALSTNFKTLHQIRVFPTFYEHSILSLKMPAAKMEKTSSSNKAILPKGPPYPSSNMTGLVDKPLMLFGLGLLTSPKIRKVVRATASAASMFFLLINAGNTCWDGGTGWNIPIYKVINETHDLWPDRSINVLSLNTKAPPLS